MGFMDKLKNTIGTERIGELEGERPSTPHNKTTKKEKKKKTPIITKAKKEKTLKSKAVEKPDVEDFSIPVELNSEDDEHAERYIKTTQVGGRSRRMILDSLNISTGAIIPNEFVTPQQIEDVEFTISVPSGLDHKEVEAFCDTMESAIEKYRNALINAYEDREKLIEEIVRTEREVIEQRNQDQLDSFLNQNSDERDELNDRLILAQTKRVELAEENKLLKDKLNELPKLDSATEINLLAENEALKVELANAREAANNSALTVSNEEFDTIQQELVNERERSAKLSEQLSLSQADNSTEKFDEIKNNELELKLNKALALNKEYFDQIEGEKETKTQNESKINELKKQIQDLLETNAELKATKVITPDNLTIESPEDYEKVIMQQFMKKNEPNKHVKKTLTQAEIEKIKKAQNSGDIKIEGINTSKYDEDPFSQMMSELNQD